MFINEKLIASNKHTWSKQNELFKAYVLCRLTKLVSASFVYKYL